MALTENNSDKVASEEVAEDSAPKVFIKTFGCQMNDYDSEKMYSLLARTHGQASNVDEASLVIVNTCSVREKGEHKLFSLLGELRDRKATQPELIIGVSGCVAQQEGHNIIKRMPAVDFVVGTHNLSLVPQLVAGVREGRLAQVAIDYRDEWEDLPNELTESAVDFAHSTWQAKRKAPRAIRALVAIQRGCDKNCSYCVVPKTRGPEVSRGAGEILREVRAKVALGAKEVLLLGQTVNSWGRDLQPRRKFTQLVEEVAAIQGVERIRFTSPHPAEVREDFIDLYGRVPQLCPHIHLPVQSGSDRVLRLMNRNYHTARYMQIVTALKERVPDIAITTDIIVGFPTESRDDFEQTLELVRNVRFNSIYAFQYSIRPNTSAQGQFAASDEITLSEKQSRLAELFGLQEPISREENQRFLGKRVEVLVEGPSKQLTSSIRGRIPQHVLIEVLGAESAPGSLLEVEVEHATPHGLRGRAVS